MVLAANISRMSDICGHTTFVDLAEGSGAWGEAIRAAVGGGRYDGFAALCAAGYDIDVAAGEFENLYLSGASA